MGGAEADPVTEMLVLEGLAYHDLDQRLVHHGRRHRRSRRSARSCRKPGSIRCSPTASIPTASISFFPAGRAVRDGKNFRLNGRWRFNSGIQHSEWVVGGTVVEGSEAENGGRPIVMFSAFPKAKATLYDNWRGVVGLRGTGSCDCSVENLALPEDQTFVWDLLQPKPRRGGASYLFPPFAYVAKEHGSVAIGGARRALDELIKLATTTRGTFRSSKLDERQVVHRFIGRGRPEVAGGCGRCCTSATKQLYEIASAGKIPDGAAIADVRAAAALRDRHCHRDGDRGVSFRRQYRPASSARDRPAAARS